MAKKIKLEHPKTGVVRETSDARTALELQVHHGYKPVKDKADEVKPAEEAPKPAKPGPKS